MGGGGEYEPKDSRNVTGTASTPDGHWTNRAGRLIDAAGQPKDFEDEDFEDDDSEDEEEEALGTITFTPDPALEKEIAEGWFEEDYEDEDYGEDEDEEQ